MSEKPVVLKMCNICKSFPGVKALNQAQLELLRGEVHVLLGENGAGKSTLMKILSGTYRADSGEIYLDGKKISITDPHSAQKHGISMIHQELMLAENVEVYKNILIGREPHSVKALGIVDKRKMIAECDRILNGQLHAGIDVTMLTEKLNVAQKQLVEIAKAISWGAKIIIMDEPTSSLTNKDIDGLFSVIGDLKKNGTTIVYISHKMDEITRISDRVTIMRDGEYIDCLKTSETTIDEMITKMVGRSLGEKYPKEYVEPGETVLSVRNLGCAGFVHDVNFHARRGEVLGIFGLIGSGRTEVVESIFGAIPVTSGEVTCFGKPLHSKNPRTAIESGIGLVPEDRKLEGLVGIMDIAGNITLPIINRIRKGPFVNRQKQQAVSREYADAIAVKSPSLGRAVRNLSGGNQQKVVIAKWLASGAQIMILDEPTRGIDIGAKIEIYKIINELQKKGICVVMISSEMPELLGISDRILVMRNGTVAKELARSEATQEEVLKWAL